MAKKILIIDNDPEYIDAVTSILEAKGYIAISALDGESGFKAAQRDNPDLILLDIMMQYVSEGLDVAVKLRDDAIAGKIPLILVTGIKKPQFLTQSFRPNESWPNVKAMIEKPVKTDELLDAIEKALN